VDFYFAPRQDILYYLDRSDSFHKGDHRFGYQFMLEELTDTWIDGNYSSRTQRFVTTNENIFHRWTLQSRLTIGNTKVFLILVDQDRFPRPKHQWDEGFNRWEWIREEETWEEQKARLEKIFTEAIPKTWPKAEVKVRDSMLELLEKFRYLL